MVGTSSGCWSGLRSADLVVTTATSGTNLSRFGVATASQGIGSMSALPGSTFNVGARYGRSHLCVDERATGEARSDWRVSRTSERSRSAWDRLQLSCGGQVDVNSGPERLLPPMDVEARYGQLAIPAFAHGCQSEP